MESLSQFVFKDSDIDDLANVLVAGTPLCVLSSEALMAIVAFNGLPMGSWCKLVDVAYETKPPGWKKSCPFNSMIWHLLNIPLPVFQGREVCVFNAENSRLAEFDRIVGDISIRRDLEEIKKNGELSEAVSILFDVIRG